VSLSFEGRNGDQVTREIFRPLAAWNLADGSNETLQPGRVVDNFRIVTSEAEPYLIQFEITGACYACPLFHFQARTRSVVEQPALAALLPANRAAGD
jgi:hypothetical protein